MHHFQFTALNRFETHLRSSIIISFTLTFCRFPDVSLTAVCAFLQMLDKSDKQIEELCTKFQLTQSSHVIVTESIFQIRSTSAIVINACGEATIMLNNISNEANNNIDCTTLAVCLWTRLFKHVNKAKKVEHIELILDNVMQLKNLKSTVSEHSTSMFQLNH